MPSPIGHALGGIAIGCAIASAPGPRLLAGLALVAILPDLDLLLPVPHRGPTHSLGAGVVAAAVALVIGGGAGRPRDRVRVALAVGAAYVSHVVLDWLGADHYPPQGVMLLWPFSDAYQVSGFDVFSRIERRYWMPGFWKGNFLAVLREIAIMAPVAWVGWRMRGGSPRRLTPRTQRPPGAQPRDAPYS